MKLLLILVFSTCALAYNADRSRILGGQQASGGEFPYQISQRVNRAHYCGGTIINSNTILTAAHCLNQIDPSSINIVVGSVTQDDGDWYAISHYVMHEDYNAALLSNDIGVIKMHGSIPNAWNVRPIPVDSNYIDAGTESVVAGWGLTSWPSEQTSHNLLYFYGSIYDLDQCKRALQTAKYPVLDTNICNYAQSGQGICRGDSGGGLVVNFKVVGIASWVIYCATGVPDVFTRTSSYTDWIARQ